VRLPVSRMSNAAAALVAGPRVLPLAACAAIQRRIVPRYQYRRFAITTSGSGNLVSGLGSLSRRCSHMSDRPPQYGAPNLRCVDEHIVVAIDDGWCGSSHGHAPWRRLSAVLVSVIKCAIWTIQFWANFGPGGDVSPGCQSVEALGLPSWPVPIGLGRLGFA
jgi:hypothetical protein